MAREYFTKTGVKLEVIDGEGLGDGIPRGQLTLVKGENRDLREDDLRLIEKFDNSRIYVYTQRYLGGGDQLQLIVDVIVDQKEFQKSGTSKKRRQNYLGGLNIDVQNYLYRFFDAAVHYPTVDHSKRASKGRKKITFKFDIDSVMAEQLGVDLSRTWPFEVIKEPTKPTPVHKSKGA